MFTSLQRHRLHAVKSPRSRAPAAPKLLSTFHTLITTTKDTPVSHVFQFKQSEKQLDMRLLWSWTGHRHRTSPVTSKQTPTTTTPPKVVNTPPKMMAEWYGPRVDLSGSGYQEETILPRVEERSSSQHPTWFLICLSSPSRLSSNYIVSPSRGPLTEK